MKILHLIDTLEIGGTEQSMAAILPRLRSGESVVCHLYRGDRLRPRLERAGIRVVSLDIAGKYAYVRACRAFLRVVRAERPALIHAALFRAGMVARAVGAFAGVPVIDSFVNDSYSPKRYAALTAGGKAKLRVLQVLDAGTARFVARFVAVSVAARRANCRALGVDDSRCTVIPRGREPLLYSSMTAAERVALRKSLGAGEETEIVLSVARLLPRKGQEVLLQAMPAITGRRKHAKLVMAGDGPARASYEKIAHELGLGDSAVFLGTRDDVPALLQAADLFVFPSLFEGFGGALVEAMLAACPIVATDTPVHREVVTPGHTGVLVPPGDPGQLAAAVVEVLAGKEKARAMGERCRALARERYAIDRIVCLYDDFYREVAREAGR